MNWLMILNAVLAVSTALFGVFALVAPQKLSGQTETSNYFPKMYAARAIPFGLGLAFVLIFLPEQAKTWLVVAGFIQAGDAWTNAKRGVIAAIASPAGLAILHWVSAWLL